MLFLGITPSLNAQDYSFFEVVFESAGASSPVNVLSGEPTYQNVDPGYAYYEFYPSPVSGFPHVVTVANVNSIALTQACWEYDCGDAWELIQVDSLTYAIVLGQNNYGLISGCTDTNSCNFDPVALIDDGSCSENCGCTDLEACNYSDAAIADDGSCDYCSCALGCGDDFQSCEVLGFALPDTDFFEKSDYQFKSDIIVPGVIEITRDWRQGLYNSVNQNGWNGEGPEGVKWKLGATEPNPNPNDYNSNWQDAVEGCPPCQVGTTMSLYLPAYNWYFDLDILSWTQGPFGGGFAWNRRNVTNTVTYGCTDLNFCNYDPLATCDDGSCASICGCTNPEACNYDVAAEYDNGTCYGVSLNGSETDCNDIRLRKLQLWISDSMDANLTDTLEMSAADGTFGEAVEAGRALLINIPVLPESCVLNIRALGANGSWGPTFKNIIFQPRDAEPLIEQAITLQQGEMFFGEDPGEGNGVPLMSESGAIAETAHGYLREGWPFEDTLLPGVLGVRVLDGSGQWSPAFRTLVWSHNVYPVLPDSLVGRNIQGVEFFLGEVDPGAGQGIALNYLDFGWDEAVEAAITYVDSLPGEDPVKFNLRAQDYFGEWGTPFVTWVWTLGRTNQTTGRPIHPMAAEYFIGTEDPGEGLANPISSLDGDWDEAVEDLFRSQVTWYEQDLPAVLSVRTKDGNGDWGHPFKKIIWPSEEYLNVELLDNDLAVAVCPGDTAYVPYSGPAGTTPTWFNGANDLTLGFVPEMSGYYTVEVTVGVDTYIDSTYVTLLPVPQADVEPDGLFLLCVGSPNQVLQSITDQPDVQWYRDGVEISQNDSIYVVGTGDYWFTSTNPETQCTSTSQTVVVTNARNCPLFVTKHLGGH